nr:sugar phosphorylase [Halalkalibaculum roseum]
MITYGDSIVEPESENHKLNSLQKFLEEHLNDTINALHILPFFPYSSDKGFSVIDYKEVRDDLGSWSDIETLASEYKLMADLVVNHISSESTWFQNFIEGKTPGKEYFIDVDPDSDFSMVTRPRSTPLLTEVETAEGTKYVWSTFSDDQIDLDFSNPDVLFEMIDIFLFYISKGVNIIRLDAIAYLWKHMGTNSIHRPETHRIVKLFRDIVEYLNHSTTLITETNVPFEENISYFGNGDEAHMVYQFSLPPLLMHAILTENAEYLRKWANNLPEPPEGCTYFNFTASHDGIGVRPLEGLVPEVEFYELVDGAKQRGGHVSYKKNSDGTESPYELNITYFDAFRDLDGDDSELQMYRYLCSQIIMMSLQGLPAFYIHNLTATLNDHEQVTETGVKRDINRKQWLYDDLQNRLRDGDSITHRVFYRLKELIEIRKEQPAFSPLAEQKVLNKDNDLFVLLRSSKEFDENILVAANVTGKPKKLKRADVQPLADLSHPVRDLISGRTITPDQEIELEPYQVMWIRV